MPIFGIVLALAAAGTFGVVALTSSLRSTGSKILQGDSVLVPLSQIQLVQAATTNDAADLQRFMSGFLQANVKVLNVIPAGDFAIGSIIGLSPPVKFPVASAISILRDGQVIT